MDDDDKRHKVIMALSEQARDFLELGADIRAIAILLASDAPREHIAGHLQTMEDNIQRCSAFLADVYRLREIFGVDEVDDE